jgi:hypothetical protein
LSSYKCSGTGVWTFIHPLGCTPVIRFLGRIAQLRSHERVSLGPG